MHMYGQFTGPSHIASKWDATTVRVENPYGHMEDGETSYKKSSRLRTKPKTQELGGSNTNSYATVLPLLKTVLFY